MLPDGARENAPPRRCIVIPALKKKAVIPDQLVKKLAGATLIERAIQTARGVLHGKDVVVVTDSQEICLVCERAGVRHHYNAALNVPSLDIVRGLREVLTELAAHYDQAIIYRASCPLLTWVDIDDAWRRFAASGADCLVTVKSVRQRVWGARGDTLDALLGDENETPVYVESKALVILDAKALLRGEIRRTIPYFLNDRAIEINSYQDWWICERLLQRRHVVFVVAGYPAIGMGHVYRALMLAHEITGHRITFLCTRESELAVSGIAARDYRTIIQRDESLADAVLALAPDLVVNDILNTEADYMARLAAAGTRVVNFEDEGPGALLADLVVNALYEERLDDPRFCYGARYFCLRDEFVGACRNEFRPEAKTVLVTFGGADSRDMSRLTLDCIEPLCRERGVAIRVVAGPGYAHKEAMETRVAEIRRAGNPLVEFTHMTNIMSRMMEGADLAVCSAGRTVYELAHMRVPAVVLAHHEREARHTFARPRNGFAYLGLMDDVSGRKLLSVFTRLLNPEPRRRLFERQSRFAFARNKAHVVGRMLALLEEETPSRAES